MKKVASRENPLIKRLNKLKTKKNREKEIVFMAEGVRFINEIPMDWEIECYVVSETFASENDLSAYEKRAELICLTDALFSSVCNTETPQGIFALCAKAKWNESVILQKKNPFLLLVEEMNDPGNLGTMIRTADACGADGVFLSQGSVEMYNPKVLRATMGSFFHVPVFQNIELQPFSKDLKRMGIPLYAAHLKGEIYPYDVSLQGSCAFLIGNEARGLSEQMAACCDKWMKLPMPGKAESLNASVAAAVLMYEVVRQRISQK